MSKAVVTIGNFDGVHAGHRALIARAREIAVSAGGGGGGGARVIAMAFDPHPTSRLRPESAPARITRFDRRVELLREAGADEVVRLEPTDELLAMTPDEFLAKLMRDVRPVAVVEGPDFNYGKGRAGSIETLIDEGKRMGFGVEAVHPVEVALSDLSIVRASSTLVRHLVAQGRVRDAMLVLGRAHEIAGVVTKGDQRGRTIGFPTANIVQDAEQAVVIPAQGVYAAWARMPDGRKLAAAVNIGARPTFDAMEPRIEAHLVDVETGKPAAGIPEYGWRLAIEIVGWVRDTVRFSGIDALKAQLERDREAALRLLDCGFDAPAADGLVTLKPAAPVAVRATRTMAQ
ncbi:MAG: bifunctional riboflavin kinase/FMN adenylyltransferase [Phycisphaeraceae bacterium]|nr:bifunctional riboflavin kinase/FMN adenylyltransferase [Phycisphaeraceae bacterium]